MEADKVNSVTLEFQGTDRRETVTLMGFDGGGPYFIYACTDPVFEATTKAGLVSMRSRDGKLVENGTATLTDWVNLLELEYAPVVVLDGEIPTRETVDPQDEVES